MLDVVKMYTSANNGEEILIFPIIPKNLPEIEDEWGHEEFVTNDASMTLIGIRKRKKISLELLLPVKTRYRHMDREAVSGEKYIEFWEKWGSRRVPMRLVITRGGHTVIHMAYTVDSLSWHYTKIQDIEAKVDITEYIFEEDLQPQAEEKVYKWETVKISFGGRNFVVTGANVDGYYITPIREVLENIGYTVRWNPADKSIWWGREAAENRYGKDFEIYNGTSYGYIRDICDAVGVSVDWDDENRVIMIEG